MRYTLITCHGYYLLEFLGVKVLMLTHPLSLSLTHPLGRGLTYQTTVLPDVMETLVYSICIAVTSFAVLAQPVVAQGASNTLPLTYPPQVLQGDGNQTCPSEELQESEE